jgi:hypothetical protein
MRTDPPPSVVVANGARPAASAADEPPLDPPGVRSGFHGLREGPKIGLSVKAVCPKDGRLVLPTTMAPAARRRATMVSSASSTGGSGNSVEP